MVDRGPSHTSLMRRSGMRGPRGRHLRIPRALGSLVAAPEGLAARTLGVVVAGGGTVALLFLVMLDEQDVEGRTGEEQEDGEDRHRETRGVQCTDIPVVAGARGLDVGGCSAERRIDDSGAGVGAVARVVGDGGKGADEQDVEEHAEEAEEGDPAETQGQDDAEDGVQRCGTGQACDGFLPGGD